MANGLVIGVGMLAGVALGPWAIATVLPIVMLFLMVRSRFSTATLVIVLVAVSAGALRGDAQQPAAGHDLIARSDAAEGIVREMPVPGGEYERVMVEVSRIRVEGAWSDASDLVLVYLPESSRSVSRGDRVALSWNVTPESRLAPGYRSFVRAEGATASAWAWKATVLEHGPRWADEMSRVRRTLTTALQGALPGDAGALAAGIVTGDDSGLSEEIEDAFRRTGTSHLTAVSGQNVALLIGFIGLWLRPGRPSTRLVVNGILLVVVWSYVLMVGLEPPAIRAAIVASLTLIGVQLGRRPDPFTLLALTLGVMAMLDPGMTGSISFWLSAAASWALCSTLHIRRQPGIVSMVIDTVKAVTAANLATFPIILWAFGSWSPASLLANVLVGPVMTLAFPVTYAFTGFAVLIPPLERALAWIPGILLDGAIVIVRRLADIAGAVHLPLDDPAAMMLLALPCFAGLLLLSRDGTRWVRLVAMRYSSEPVRMWMLASGLVAGGLVGVLLLALP